MLFTQGEQIHPQRTPDLFQAAIRSLELRLENFGGHTGWSRAWTACCFARMGKGNESLDHVEHLISDFASSSLLDLHPPNIFQIDGNIAGAAAVIEMLFQSYYSELHFLPALPDAWSSGSITGLRGRGGYQVSIRWENGCLLEADVISSRDCKCHIVDSEGTLQVVDKDGSTVPVNRDAHLLTFDSKAGDTYFIKTV